MNKLDVSSSTFALSPASHSDPSTGSGQRPNPAPRLIVLIPASETDTPDLEHRIWEIARSLRLNVLLLSLTNDFVEEAQLRRKLITMAAMIKEPNVSTDILIEHGNDWVKQVRKIWQKGDIVACYAGQKVGLLRKPLDQVLKSSLEATIYILSDYRPIKNPKRTFLSQFFFWSGSLAIIGGFFWAEVKIVQMPQDWAHTALIYVCLLMEFALILLWNSLFR
jgi:hypothetical protein